MPPRLSNAPATFNRLVNQLFRPMPQFTQTYFYDIFVQIKAEGGKTDVETHIEHLRKVLSCMREYRLYENILTSAFWGSKDTFLGCFLGKDGIRADPEKIRAIAQWPTPTSQKDLRK